MKITKCRTYLRPSSSHVLLRPFLPDTPEHGLRILSRVLGLAEERVQELTSGLIADFELRHRSFVPFLLQRYTNVRPLLQAEEESLSYERKLLIGAYFTQEYSLEAAALFNPSMVVHPDQSHLEPGNTRLLVSLRAVGEGHISSICFLTCTIDLEGNVEMEPTKGWRTVGVATPDASYDRHLMKLRLSEIGVEAAIVEEVFGPMAETFTMGELEANLATVRSNQSAAPEISSAFDHALLHILSLAQSNYEVRFNPDTPLDERVLFPTTPSERNGMEDARFVRFEATNGAIRYYATYTAYNGIVAVPQLIETVDFLRFGVSTLNGSEISNKGMALFPRKVGGRYAMLGRQDGENLFVMFSDHPHFWTNKRQILEAEEPWEFIKVGNCGSPIETEAGWLVLTHGVGPMRTYAISACLLDINDPQKVIGRLRSPLLVANEEERNGYVPNVVYSCGSLVHQGRLILPYAVSDVASSIATVDLAELLEEMRPP